MEKNPAMMEVRMMAIFLESSSRYCLSRSFSSSISPSSSSSSEDSLSELSSSGSSMLSSLGLSILYQKSGSFNIVSTPSPLCLLQCYLLSQLLTNCFPLFFLFPRKVWFSMLKQTVFFRSIHKLISGLAPVLFFSLFFCQSSIATVVIVTRKPRECLGIKTSQ